MGCSLDGFPINRTGVSMVNVPVGDLRFHRKADLIAGDCTFQWRRATYSVDRSFNRASVLA